MFVILMYFHFRTKFLCLEMAKFKNFPIMLSTFILRIIHVTHLREHDVFLLSCTILPYSLF